MSSDYNLYEKIVRLFVTWVVKDYPGAINEKLVRAIYTKKYEEWRDKYEEWRVLYPPEYVIRRYTFNLTEEPKVGDQIKLIGNTKRIVTFTKQTGGDGKSCPQDKNCTMCSGWSIENIARRHLFTNTRVEIKHDDRVDYYRDSNLYLESEVDEIIHNLLNNGYKKYDSD